MKNYETPSLFMNIFIDEHDFEEQFCLMASSCIDLDITEERPTCFDYPRFPLDYKQCDYYEEFNMPIDLLVAFTSVLVRIYVNYVLIACLNLILFCLMKENRLKLFISMIVV